MSTWDTKMVTKNLNPWVEKHNECFHTDLIKKRWCSNATWGNILKYFWASTCWYLCWYLYYPISPQGVSALKQKLHSSGSEPVLRLIMKMYEEQNHWKVFFVRAVYFQPESMVFFKRAQRPQTLSSDLILCFSVLLIHLSLGDLTLQSSIFFETSQGIKVHHCRDGKVLERCVLLLLTVNEKK